MQVRWIHPEEAIGGQRGDVVVCIPVYNGYEHFVECLRSVLTHTSADVPILVCDDASPDARVAEFVSKLDGAAGPDHELLYLRREHNLGFPANVNGAFALAAPADVVVLNSDCEVADGWLDGLRAAAYSDSRVATATALTNHGTLVSVPGRDPGRLPPEWTFEDAAAVIRTSSLRLRPRLPTAIGHCVYVRRAALELIGDFDLGFSPGYGEEVDFSQRCIRMGLCHVAADEVLVLHHGGGSFASDGSENPVKAQHERVLAARYPYYQEWVRAIESDHAGALARSLSAARRALKGLSVVIDARILGGPMTGTQVQVLEVIAALARTERTSITVIVPDELGDYAERTLAGLPELRRLTRVQATALGDVRGDVVHRPYQVNNDEDLSFLAGLGERLIVTNQDLIAYHNPSYFTDSLGWHGYRRITRSALAVADHVVFVSEHARDDALAEDLVEPSRASVVHNGVDHSLTDMTDVPAAPRGAERIPAEAQAILCLGTDFRHKNRVFALRMLEVLRRVHQWDGYLLFAGPRVTRGSSTLDEAELLALQPDLADALIDFAAVSEPEKTWLLRRTALVLYPTIHEGFGLIPFEAASHGVPCMWAPGTALKEVLPDSAAAILAWDAHRSAERALELLRDTDARERNLAAIRGAGVGLTWDAAAARLLEIYNATCDAPATPASGLERRHGLMNGALSEDAMRLIGPGGALPEDVERPLLALATHPQIGRPLFRAIKFGYRASFRLRRMRGTRRG